MPIKITKFNHTTIAAPPGEQKKVIWFYEEVLGLERLLPPSMLSAAYDIWWYKIGDKILHVDFDPPFVKVAHNRHIAIEVEDLEEARRHFHKYNIETRGDVDVPKYYRFHVDDPFGNGIEILEIKKKKRRKVA
ncbi:MAG: VOC family protein [Chlamydiales bacterium]